MMKNYLILKENTPWESIRRLFPMIPIVNKPPISAKHKQSGITYQCHNLDVCSFTEEQTIAMARLGIHWIVEEKLPDYAEPVAVHRMALIPVDWVEEVVLETPSGKLLPQRPAA